MQANFPIDGVENFDDLALFIERRRYQNRECLKLGAVDARKIGRLVSDLEKVGFPIRALRKVGKKLRQKALAIWPHGENVILVNAEIQLASPNKAASEFIEVAALRENYIASLKAITLNLRSANMDHLHLREIKVTVLNICDTKVRDINHLGVHEFPTLRDAGLDRGAFIQS